VSGVLLLGGSHADGVRGVYEAEQPRYMQFGLMYVLRVALLLCGRVCCPIYNLVDIYDLGATRSLAGIAHPVTLACPLYATSL
jgi:hypothetical protein